MERGFLRRQSLLLIGLSCCLAQNLGPAQQGVASFYGGPQVRIEMKTTSSSLLSLLRPIWKGMDRALWPDLSSVLPQDNTSPNVASFGLLSGSCGYGLLQQKQWPFWQASAISAGNIVYSSGNPKGCGACIQATCTSVRTEYSSLIKQCDSEVLESCFYL